MRRADGLLAMLVVAATGAAADEPARGKRDPQQRFQQAAAEDPEAKRRIAADIDRMFAKQRHTLICRASVCRLELFVRPGERLAWPAVLNDDALMHKTGASMVQGGPDADGRYVAWLPVYTPAAPSGGELLRRVVELYHASAEKRACDRPRQGLHGSLAVSLAVEPGRGISASVAGTLRDSAYGRCVAEAVAHAVAQVPVPDGADQATWSSSESF